MRLRLSLGGLVARPRDLERWRAKAFVPSRPAPAAAPARLVRKSRRFIRVHLEGCPLSFVLCPSFLCPSSLRFVLSPNLPHASYHLPFLKWEPQPRLPTRPGTPVLERKCAAVRFRDLPAQHQAH